jgi:hypothetical protein
MVTKLLADAGLYLGPEADMTLPGPANPEGFWENKRFLQLNVRILRQFGGDWDLPPEDVPCVSGNIADSLRDEATELVREFEGKQPWGWKDPRNCLTLPFWKGLIDGLRVVIVVRHPLEVAESLRARNGVSRALGLRLWREYNGRVLAASDRSERIVCHYDAFFDDPGRELRRLVAALGMPIPENIEGITTAKVDNLRHHRSTIETLLKENVTPDIVELYRALSAEAEWAESDSEGVATNAQALPDSAASGVSEEIVPDAPAHPWRRDRAHPRTPRQHLKVAEARIAELERTIESLRTAIAEREAFEQDATPRLARSVE